MRSILGRFGAIESASLSAHERPRRAGPGEACRGRFAIRARDAVPDARGRRAIAVAVKGGIPSLEKGVGDPRDRRRCAPGSTRRPTATWSRPDAGDLLRAMDRFHRIPPTPEFAASWAEWLYFNGRTRDGRARFYLTFMVGPASAPGRRAAGVRLQLDRDGVTTTYAAVDRAGRSESRGRTAPDLDIAGNRVRLEGLRYRIELALPGATGDARPRRRARAVAAAGDASAARADGSPDTPRRCYREQCSGTLTVGRDRIEFADAAGYHDHNWGFWRGVRWQWGQVAHGDLSILYGRVFPPADVADPDRIPGFLGVLGSNGVVGFSSTVSIGENGGSPDDGQPKRIHVHAAEPDDGSGSRLCGGAIGSHRDGDDGAGVRRRQRIFCSSAASTA